MSALPAVALILGAAYYFSQQEESGAATSVGGGHSSILGTSLNRIRDAMATDKLALLEEGRKRELLGAGLLAKLKEGREVSEGLGLHLDILTKGQESLRGMIEGMSLGKINAPSLELPDIPTLIPDWMKVPTPTSTPGLPTPSITWDTKANTFGQKLMSVPWQFGKGALWDYPFSQGLKMREAVDSWIGQIKGKEWPDIGVIGAYGGSKILDFAVPGKGHDALLNHINPPKKLTSTQVTQSVQRSVIAGSSRGKSQVAIKDLIRGASRTGSPGSRI